MTGNTEVMAEILEHSLLEEGLEVTVKEALRAKPKEMLKYDGILLGAYTYEGGEIGDEFMLFYEEMDQVDLTGKLMAVLFQELTDRSLYSANVHLERKPLSQRVAVRQ